MVRVNIPSETALDMVLITASYVHDTSPYLVGLRSAKSRLDVSWYLLNMWLRTCKPATGQALKSTRKISYNTIKSLTLRQDPLDLRFGIPFAFQYLSDDPLTSTAHLLDLLLVLLLDRPPVDFLRSSHEALDTTSISKTCKLSSRSRNNNNKK